MSVDFDTMADRCYERGRQDAIEACARELETSYPDHAWLNAACAAIRSLAVSRPTREAP